MLRTTPPSTRSAAPFVPLAAALAVYTIMFATSSGVAKRPNKDDGRAI